MPRIQFCLNYKALYNYEHAANVNKCYVMHCIYTITATSSYYTRHDILSVFVTCHVVCFETLYGVGFAEFSEHIQSWHFIALDGSGVSPTFNRK